MHPLSFKDKVFSISSQDQFLSVALEVFRYQYECVEVYRQFCEALKIRPNQISSLEKIPFLPIELFKSLRIATSAPDEVVFTSSSTGGIPSSHHVVDISWYRQSFLRGFTAVYGPPEEWCILALLPAYLERSGSSLVYMAQELISRSKSADSGFYLNDLSGLAEVLKRRETQGQRTILLGVSFALLDLAERHPMQLRHTIVMETGGMKGRRRELTRPELHQTLQSAFGLTAVHSEYGMTELLSQAYSKGEGLFTPPPWMQVLIRDSKDPLAYVPTGRTGALNVIDLANINSCSFIATSDIGRSHASGEIEILGRMDQSDIRGCNLMVL